MRIYLPEVRSKLGGALKFHFEKDFADCFVDFSESGTLNVLVSASFSGDKILVNGSLEASMAAVCSRCLETFRYSFKIDFSEAFTVIKRETGDEGQDNLAAEAANMLTVSGDYLYLDEYIRQLVILAQEYNPLCKPDCKGICAGCGTDLNRSICRCNTTNNLIDARLLKLKEYKSGI